MQIQKLKLGQQNNDKGSIKLAGAKKKATLKCKKIIIKTLAKLYESVYCHSKPKNYLDHVINMYKGGNPKPLNLNFRNFWDLVQVFGPQFSIF